MILNYHFIKKFFLASLIFAFLFTVIKAEEEDTKDLSTEIERINKDLKTLEKAFYKTSEIKTSNVNSSGLNEDILTRHLLKLNEIEEQFRQVTNKYEEINFKLDKLSNRFRKRCC